MRVIAGTAKRLELKTISGMDTRPTTDRIKETLFNMISYEVPDSHFLDLFSGSGGIGIEALSRGAESCVFVEKAEAAARCIEYNLNHTHLKENARLMKQDVFSAISKLHVENQTFSIIFMDPPYGKLLEKEVLKALTGTSLLDKETMIIVEASLDTDFDYLESFGYRLLKEKRYKTNKHLFIELQ